MNARTEDKKSSDVVWGNDPILRLRFRQLRIRMFRQLQNELIHLSPESYDHQRQFGARCSVHSRCTPCESEAYWPHQNAVQGLDAGHAPPITFLSNFPVSAPISFAAVNQDDGVRCGEFVGGPHSFPAVRHSFPQVLHVVRPATEGGTGRNEGDPGIT